MDKWYSPITEFFWLLQHGVKMYGWEGRDEWPNKPYWYIGSTWYDGPHFVIHVYKFYFGMSPYE